MNLSVSVEVRENYLLLIVSGRWVLQDMLALIDIGREEAQKADRNRLLIDIRGIRGVPSNMDRFDVGEQLAKQIRYSRKIAILYQADLINKLAENTAVNRGVNMAVFYDEAEALEWLLG